MDYSSNILVVANRTARSASLEAALRDRLARGPATFTLVLPLGRSAGAEEHRRATAASLEAAGIDVDVEVGDADPLYAVLDRWSPARFDEIIVSTLPAWKSRWMKAGLVQRIERHTGALVRHVEMQEAPAPHSARAVAH